MSETPQVVPGITVQALITELTPEYIKKVYLMGLNFVDTAGIPYPDSWYLQLINNAIVVFERITKVHVVRRTITEEMHDYDSKDYQTFCFLQLFEYPVKSVERVAAVYPTGQTVFEFPIEWVRLTKEHGQIQLVPTQGSLSSVILGQGGSYLPVLYSGMGYLPQLFRVNYTTGFDDGKIPWDIIDAIAKLAVIQMLTIVGDTVYPPGVTSVSVSTDGISQSMGLVNNGQLPPVFAGRIQSYRNELYGDPRIGMPGQLNLIAQHFRGIQMQVI